MKKQTDKWPEEDINEQTEERDAWRKIHAEDAYNIKQSMVRREANACQTTIDLTWPQQIRVANKQSLQLTCSYSSVIALGSSCL